MIRIKLKRGHEGAATHGHPWVFSGAVGAIEGDAAAGGVADVYSSGGRWVGRGLMHPSAALAVRIYSRIEGQALDAAFFVSRVREALAVRSDLCGHDSGTDAFRLVFAEADGLSGLVIDRYADALVVQVDARGLLPFIGEMIDVAAQAVQARRVVVRTDPAAEAREGLTAADVSAFARGDADRVMIRESGFRFQVALSAGQKTGFYLDQRENRRRVARYAAGRRVLSAYCYTGAFEVHAAAAGAATILGIDSSAPAIEQASEHHRLNESRPPVEYLTADVPAALRSFRDAGRSFDLVILDPPRFVATHAQLEKGLRAYKDVNLLAMKLLTPGGVLATFSCSGHVTAADLRKVLGWSAMDAGRTVRIVETLSQPADHPILAVFPESEYLKGFVCRVE